MATIDAFDVPASLAFSFSFKKNLLGNDIAVRAEQHALAIR